MLDNILERFKRGLDAMAMFSSNPEVSGAMGRYVAYLGSLWLSMNLMRLELSYATLYDLQQQMNGSLPELPHNRFSGILEIRAISDQTINTPSMINGGGVMMRVHFKTHHAQPRCVTLYNLTKAELERDYRDYLDITMYK